MTSKKGDLPTLMTADVFEESMIEPGIVSDLFQSLEFIMKIEKKDGLFIAKANLEAISIYVEETDDYSLKFRADQMNELAYNKGKIALQFQSIDRDSELDKIMVKIYHAPNGKYFTIADMISCLEDFAIIEFTFWSNISHIIEIECGDPHLGMLQEQKNKSHLVVGYSFTL